MTADLDDMRAYARVLHEAGTDLTGIAGRVTALAVDGNFLQSFPFSPGSGAQAEARLLDVAAELAKRTVRLDVLATLLSTKAELIEQVDAFGGAARDGSEWGTGFLVGMAAPVLVRLAVPAAAAGAAGAVLIGGVWFVGGAEVRTADAWLDCLSGRTPWSELDDRLKAAPGEQAAQMKDVAVSGLGALQTGAESVLREHPEVTDELIGAMPGFVNGLAGPFGLLVPDSPEGVLRMLMGVTAPFGVFDDRSVRITRVGREQTRPLTSAAAIWQSASELQATTDGDPDRTAVRMIRVTGADGAIRWVVQIPGTQQWGPVTGRDPSDITSNLVLMSRQDAGLTTAVAEAMTRAGVKPGQPVMMMGHSQGGIAAAAMASDPGLRTKFNITTVFTGGSPIARMDIPPGVQVLSLEHDQDLVPRLDSQPNPDLPNWTTVHRDLSGILADNLDPMAPHGASQYRATALLLDAAAARAAAGSLQPGDGAAARAEAPLLPFFSGDAVSWDVDLRRADR